MITVANVRTFRGDSRHAMMVDRSTIFGNPFRMEERTAAERVRVVNKFREYWHHPEQAHVRDAFVVQIEKHQITTLICHCSPAACHADVLADWYNKWRAIQTEVERPFRWGPGEGPNRT